ncbi:MAG TPA: proprotein convertase P-domain-containing protein [Thermoanaerobaculia bacterium]|nr:proprotein convertase P-domain-containing protein [Thermoanaerobaculia bacterium]
MLLSLLLAISVATPDLRLELERQSLTGTHSRYRQYIDGLPVIGGEVNVTLRRDGTREEHRALAQAGPRPPVPPAADLVWVNVEGAARLTIRERADGEHGPVVRYVDAGSRVLVRQDVLAYPSKPAFVFDPNPVARLNAPDLRDQNDSPAAVPPEAYSLVELLDVNESGPLGGPWVQIADFQAPFIPPADASGPLLFDRSESGFEDVNTYYHVDRSQRHLQFLGYTGPRTVAPYPIEADTHAAGGTDNSFFTASSIIAGRGRLHFGTGGTDDAEDSDLIVHEYAHAIHEWIAPGTFLGSFGSEARAISEGLGDYWGFSAKYAAALHSGRDPFCFADWDARCWTNAPADMCIYPPGSDCLRRLDSPKRVADFIRSETPGTEHRNGEIWSAALAEIFTGLTRRHGPAEGKRIADTLVIESLFGAPPHPGFATMARRMLVADRYVSGGGNGDIVCAAMSSRGILDDCATVPRGELTYVPGAGSGMVVPDNDPAGITLRAVVSDSRPIERLLVPVDIRHRGRGELRVTLIAPDGTTVRLHETSGERAPDLVTTFGRDTLPVDSLDVFRGRSATGEWRLRVVDAAPADLAMVVSWGLLIQFAGDEPAEQRPAIAGRRQVVPVAGHGPGANATFFRTDLRMLSRGIRETEVLLIFTPSGMDGRNDFAAVRTLIRPEAVLVLDDVVRTLFATAGPGQIEVAGEVIASTRTWTPGEGGTFGLFAPAIPVEEAVGEGETSAVVHLLGGPAFRSNIGFAEVAGGSGRVSFRYRDAAGEILTVHPVAPHTHFQAAVPAAAFQGPEDDVHAAVIVEGDARVIAYGATIDNRSGDPMFVPAQRDPAGELRLIPAISAGGVAGTGWRTELAIGSSRSGMATLTYATRTGTETKDVVLEPRVPDIVGTAFGRGGSRGTLLSATGEGIVSARIWTEGPKGSHGQFVPFRAPSGAPVQDVLHVESSEAFRTNIGLLTDVESQVRVTIFSADNAIIGTSEHQLRPFQLEQFQVVQPVVNGRARIEVIRGRVYAYGSVVDNRTGDPIFVPAR